MPSHDRENSSCNGVSRSNLFLESDPDDDLRRAVVSPAAAAASARGFSAARQRGRGLVVPVVDAHPPRGARSLGFPPPNAAHSAPARPAR